MSAKSAKKYRERLEGSYRLIRIKKIKRGFYLMQVVLALVIASIVSFMMGMNIEPFFIPSDMFLFIMLIFGAAMVAEGVYFRGMEMKYTKSKSRRFLIARNSIRASAVAIILSGLVILLLFIPATDDYISSSFEDSNRVNDVPLRLDADGGNNNSQSFIIQSHPSTGIVKLDNLILSIDTGADLELAVSNEVDFLLARNINQGTENIYDLSEYSSSRTDFTVVISNSEPVPINGTYSYHLDYGMSNIFKIFIPAILMVMIIIQMVSISVMLPLREMYASSSIYSKHYIHEKEEGTERLADRMKLEAQQKAIEEAEREAREAKEAKEAAMFEETIDVATLKAPAPPKPVETSPITKMGDLDAGLDDESDVPCPKCGEMNSPQVAMCFVCGNPMVVAEEEAIDINEIMAKGDSSMLAKKYMEAGRFFDQIISQDNANERALLGKGRALNAQDKWGMAVQYVNTVININPDNTDALLLKGQILEARGKTEMALEVYNRIMIINPFVQIAITKKKELSMEIEDMIVAAAAAQADEMPIASEVIAEDEQDVVESFMELPGIGLAKASALYEAGFISMNKLRSASEADLTKVKGISPRLAKKIKG